MSRRLCWSVLAVALSCASVALAQRDDRAGRGTAPRADPEAAVAGQDGIVRYGTRGYENLWYPNLQSPPEDSPSAGPDDAAQQLGTSTRSLVDERPLWRMLSRREYDRTREWLDKFEDWHPDWQPSERLLRVLGEGELLQRIQQARDAEDWATLVELAAEHPDAFTCESVFNLWALAEARAALDGPAAAHPVFRSIVETCPRPEDRLVTLQRAAATLAFADTAALLARERGRSLTDAERRALRGFELDFYADWLAAAAGQGDSAAADRAGDRLAELVRLRRDAERARLLGWTLMDRGAPERASTWFGRALHWAPSGENAHALALAWLRAGRPEEAEMVARTWYGADPRIEQVLAELVGARARAAFARGDYAEALAAAEAELARRAPPGSRAAQALRRLIAWSLFNLGRNGEAFDAFAGLYAGSPGSNDLAAAVIYAAVAAERYEAALSLADDADGRLAALLARAPGGAGDADADADADAETAELRYLFYQAYAGAALSAEQHAAVLDRTAPIRGLIRARQDADLAASLGWTHLALDRPAEAEPWFRHALDWGAGADAAVGLVEALRDGDRPEAAEAVARRWAARKPLLAQAARDLILARADRAYAADDAERALALVQDARAVAGPSRRGRKLEAWSQYRLDRPADAAAAFEALYRARQDRDVAEGLFFSARAAGQEASLHRLSAELGGPLADRWRDFRAERYLDQDLYVLAAQTADGSDARLRGLDGTHVTLAPSAATREGDPGLGQLDSLALEASASRVVDRHRFGLRLRALHLSAGDPDPSARLGTANAERPRGGLGNAGRAGAADTDAQVLLPALSWQVTDPALDGADILSLELGTTPLGGAVGLLPTGMLGVERRRPWGRAAVAAFAEPRADSLLSFAGLDDPTGQGSWGRVVEAGVRTEGRLQLTGAWSVFGSARASWLDGKNVDDNHRLAVAAGLSHGFDLEGFDYIGLGPDYRFEHYAENLSRFSAGHGGYFSPETLHRVGFGGAFQTDDAARFVLRGSGSLGWQTTEEAATVQFPLRPSGNPGADIPGSDASGFAADAQLSGAYRLSERLVLGANASTILSADFNAFAGGVFLRLSLDGRGAAVAGDIPPARRP